MTYVIKRTCYWYGPSETKDLVQDTSWQGDGGAMVFDTRDEAQAHIDGTYDHPYYLNHNESGRPDLKIMRMNRVPKYPEAPL